MLAKISSVYRNPALPNEQEEAAVFLRSNANPADSSLLHAGYAPQKRPSIGYPTDGLLVIFRTG